MQTRLALFCFFFFFLFTADEQRTMLGSLSFYCRISTLTYCNLFSSRLLTSLLCNLSDPLAALLRLTCRYAMATSSQLNETALLFIVLLFTFRKCDLPISAACLVWSCGSSDSWQHETELVDYHPLSRPTAWSSVQPFVGNRNVHINDVWGVESHLNRLGRCKSP